MKDTSVWPTVQRCNTNYRHHVFAFLTLFIFLGIIYGNSLQGGWHFDDTHNIVNNVNVHLRHLSWSDIEKTFYYEGQFSRPVSRLSFAVNYYIGGLNVTGYHIVNFIIHYVTAVFLFLLIYNTLKLPSLVERYGDSSYQIALLSTFLWAINPVQVLAVTYIVQRMASMAGMFYCIALYCYLKGRTAHHPWKSTGFFTTCFIAALFAFGSKENAFMLPFILCLYDLLLIQGLSMESVKTTLKFLAPLFLLFVISVMLFTDLLSILAGYKFRTFSLTERLLTEPRIILFYISLLLYPISSRLTLLHDVDISRSLFQPWTTIPSILVLLCMITWALIRSRQRPLISFSILFFLANHLIESSIIPLETVFEHRNYVPSFFFFVPVSIFTMHVLDYLSRRETIRWFAAFVLVFIMISQGHTVSMRNDLLRSELSLWLDNVGKSPALSLAHNNLGLAYQRCGLRQFAILEMYAAQRLNNYQHTRSGAIVEYNIGQFWLNEGKDDRALFHYQKALSICPGFADALAGISVVMLREGKLTMAEKCITRALRIDPSNMEMRQYLSFILLKMDHLRDATREAHNALESNQELSSPLMVLAEVHRKRGHYTEATNLWKEYARRKPNSPTAQLALIDLYHSTGQIGLRDRMIRHLYLLRGKKGLDDLFRKDYRDMAALAYSPDMADLRSILEEYAASGNVN